MRTTQSSVTWLAGLVLGLMLAAPAAAVMHPTLGRWMQRDPLGYPDGYNAYAGYHAIGGDLDPLGLAKCLENECRVTYLKVHPLGAATGEFIAWHDKTYDGTFLKLVVAYGEELAGAAAKLTKILGAFDASLQGANILLANGATAEQDFLIQYKLRKCDCDSWEIDEKYNIPKGANREHLRISDKYYYKCVNGCWDESAGDMEVSLQSFVTVADAAYQEGYPAQTLDGPRLSGDAQGMLKKARDRLFNDRRHLALEAIGLYSGCSLIKREYRR